MDDKKRDVDSDVEMLDPAIMMGGESRPRALPEPNPSVSAPAAVSSAGVAPPVAPPRASGVPHLKVEFDPPASSEPPRNETQQSGDSDAPPSVDESWTAAKDAADAEREYAAQHITDTFNVALLGGKGVGKSYLFQSMVYRTHGRGTGALSPYLANNQTWLYKRQHHVDAKRRAAEPFRLINKKHYIAEYEAWQRLGSTSLVQQAWYRLHLPYKTGLMGRGRSEMKVSFFDGSGDHLQSAFDEKDSALWKEAFVDASVLVLCLPMWAAFPDRSMLDNLDCFYYEPDDPTRPPGNDLRKPVSVERKTKLREFHAILHNYGQARRAHGANHRVDVVVALTQADSPLCERTTRDAWIIPYIRNHPRYLRQLRRGSGVAQYLANAREISRYLTDICDQSTENDISNLLNLDYGRGTPWFVPVTAIEGEDLDRLDPPIKPGAASVNPRKPSTSRHRTDPPVPAHVELPLLIALCEQHNALA